jgi:hypothetical protein
MMAVVMVPPEIPKHVVASATVPLWRQHPRRTNHHRDPACGPVERQPFKDDLQNVIAWSSQIKTADGVSVAIQKNSRNSANFAITRRRHGYGGFAAAGASKPALISPSSSECASVRAATTAPCRSRLRSRSPATAKGGGVYCCRRPVRACSGQCRSWFCFYLNVGLDQSGSSHEPAFAKSSSFRRPE